MSRMFNLTYVLEFIVDRFYDRSLSDQNFLTHGHQAVFHVVTDACDQMYIIDEQYVCQFLGYVPFVCK